LPAEVVEMVGWIARVEGISAADFIVPLIRNELVARYKKWEAEISRIKAAEDQATKAVGRDPLPPLPVPDSI
jgi:hypothetical protein